MALTDIKLRILTDALLTTKGSRLTMQEVDTNFITLVAQIVALNGNGGATIEAYNPATTYIGGNTYFVSYDGNIYEFISATDQTGQTPDSYPAIWELSSSGAMTHQQGTDETLALNGDYEISAEDIYNFLARYNGILKPALDFADGLSAPPSSTDGDIYVIQAGTTISSTAINWQSGTTVRFQYAATDLSSYSAGMYLDVQNALDSVHDGQWLISTVSDGSDYIEVTNANVTDATNDSTTSDTYVSHGDWGGVAQNSWVIKDSITGNWEEVVPFEGLSCFIISTERVSYYLSSAWSYVIDAGNTLSAILSNDNNTNGNNIEIADGDAIEIKIGARTGLIYQTTALSSNRTWEFPDADGFLSVLTTAPATAASSGVVGQIAYDSSYFYVCIAANTWKRTAISTW